MNKFTRRHFAIAALACAVLPGAAMAQTPAKPKVALVMKSLANEFFLTMENGAREYQKANASKFDLIANGIKDERIPPTRSRSSSR
jgi:ribose transport system substrate-binding protein